MKKCILMFAFLVLTLLIAIMVKENDRLIPEDNYSIEKSGTDNFLAETKTKEK